MPADQGPIQARPTILVIDDDEPMRTSLTYLLELSGYRVVTAEDGHQGLRAFHEESPAAVVTDIMMPQQDGIGTIREMRRLDPQAKIIAISGGGRIDKSDYLSVAEKLGADIGIEKSDVRTKLLDILRSLLTG